MDESTHNELRGLEERLLETSVRNSREQLAELLADDFVEFGSSGRVFDKRQVIEALCGEGSVARSVSDFRAEMLGADAALVTYRVRRVESGVGDVACSLRSSIWRCWGGRWVMRFHQGTAVPDEVE